MIIEEEGGGFHDVPWTPEASRGPPHGEQELGVVGQEGPRRQGQELGISGAQEAGAVSVVGAGDIGGRMG